MTVVGLVIVLGKWLLEVIVPKFKGKSFEGDLSAWIVYNNLDKKDKILIFK